MQDTTGTVIGRAGDMGQNGRMGLFSRRSRTAGGSVVSDRSSAKADLAALREFAESRSGVEAFIEPRTSVTQTTLLLVAGTGESMRRRVQSPQAAQDFVRKKLQIPVYDVNLVGLPQRKREWDLRQAGATSSRSSSRTASGAGPRRAAPSASASSPAPPSAPSRSSRELAAIMILEKTAGVEPLSPNPTFDQLMKVYRQARSKAHPDRNGGDRTTWDKVEESARALDLPD